MSSDRSIIMYDIKSNPFGAYGEFIIRQIVTLTKFNLKDLTLAVLPNSLIQNHNC